MPLLVESNRSLLQIKHRTEDFIYFGFILKNDEIAASPKTAAPFPYLIPHCQIPLPRQTFCQFQGLEVISCYTPTLLTAEMLSSFDYKGECSSSSRPVPAEILFNPV